ncbi:RUN and FYVE domain-containing protein 4 isoform X3 [Fukomys damarensis]|uniref:RUN and FYVE domain-containing protein 4 isoform X3 n=1 Tax=Fukomys damarensis TaxID=885580 RepID=UPI0014553D79|nr:RUN and FYVE domain-containing protein 4 isoform X3 [Fukomys damarensis]
MAKEGATLKVTRDLKAAVSAILQGYGDGKGPVMDTSAELHRLCGCLELLLQFEQKEQKSFLGPQKDYWDFLCTALRRQRGDLEQIRFISSQDKLKTSLGKGRAFLRSCLARGQLAESLQLCLLSPELTREWYGPRSPLLCLELQEDILDSLYALNGVAFDLDLQRQDLDGAWPMFSESHCNNSSQTQGRRPRKTKESPKKLAKSGTDAELTSLQISAASGGPRGVQLEEPRTNQAGCLRDTTKDQLAGLSRPQQHMHLSFFLEKKTEDSRSLGSPRSTWEPKGELQLDQEDRATRSRRFLENSTASSQQQPERAKEAQKEKPGMEAEDRRVLPGPEVQRTEGAHGEEAEQDEGQAPLASSPRGMMKEATSGSRQRWEVPSILGESWVLQDLGTKEVAITEQPQEQTEVTGVARKEEQAEVPLQEVVKSLRLGLRKAEEQAQCQEQLVRVRDGELQALQEQLHRCEEERAQLQAELGQKQQEAKRRDAMYKEELGGQRDLIQAMKRRMLELIQEKDRQWQRLQKLSCLVPSCCIGCSKVFSRLSRRYPCRHCGGLVCHACSADYKKRGRCCPCCVQG